ncbi:MAG: tetratricopeptide repeat protein [bacterium]|nr:tetratricopeptide repeat protein [bacterium]
MSTKKLLKRARRNLYRVIEDPQFWTVAFCRSFFDWCDEQAYEFPDSAMRYGDLAVELAKKTGDRHALARAHGVMAIAYRLVSLFDRAEAEFDQAFKLAGTCSCCLSDIYRRKGSLRMYQKQFATSIELYNQAIEHYRAIDDEDGIGRTLVSRGISLCLTNRIDEALEDERTALTLLSLETPSIYHLGALTNIAGILAYGTDEHCRLALSYLEMFEGQLAGVPGATAVRVRLSWAKGLILARLGERKRGLQMLRKARAALFRNRHDVEFIAISADIARLYCDTEKYHLIVGIVRDCLQRLDDVLGTRKLLKKVLYYSERHLIETRDAAISLRSAIEAPIPCLLEVKTPSEAFSAP